MKRIGVCFTRPRGSTERRDEYGIYDSGVCIYEGYRFIEKDGTETMVGLPLAGRGAAHLQPHILFDPKHYEVVHYFEEK